MNVKNLIPIAAIAACVLVAEPSDAFAGGGGEEFAEIFDTLTDWIEGVLGRILALIMVVAGIGMGIIRQSLAAFGIGIGSGLGLVNAPTIVDNIVTASIEHGPVLTEQLPAVAAVVGIAAR
ncbi:MAG: TraA family conjugative transfer protein [Geminicoccaceae bacterium]